jgi:hypothetical protein
MNSLLDRFIRLRLASSLPLDDTIVRERRISELRALLEEIAAPGYDSALGDDDRGEGERLEPSFS